MILIWLRPHRALCYTKNSEICFYRMHNFSSFFGNIVKGDYFYRFRWHCKACGYLSVNRNALMQHFGKRHSGEPADHEPLSPDNAIEEWVHLLYNSSLLHSLLFTFVSYFLKFFLHLDSYL